MWLHQKYGMSWIVNKLYSMKTNNLSYSSVPENGWSNRKKNECEWWSMNVSALKIWNESNHTFFYSVETNNCSYLAVPDDGRLNRQKTNMSDEVWMWLHQTYGMSQIIRNFHLIETNNCSYLSVPGNGRLNQQNNECEWWSMKLSAPKLWNESNRMKIVFSQNKQLLIPCCSQRW